MSLSRYYLAISLVLVAPLLACADRPQASGQRFGEPTILVGLATGEGGGDLPAVLQEHPDLASALPDIVAPLVEAQSDGFIAGHLVASVRVVGATEYRDEVWLYAHESMGSYARDDGTAQLQSGRSMPVRIRLRAGSLEAIGIDEPLDGASMGPSLAAIMPQWAIERALPLEFDEARMQEAADLWAETQ